MEINLDVKYYYIINSDLNMSKGKIAAQVSHVAMQLGKVYGVIGRAIVLKASETELWRYLSLTADPRIPPMYYIKDAGLTEVPPDSLTCIGFKETEYIKERTKSLKLV